jgi:ABC-type uncharacterized transport system substrate-binding protein
MKGLKGKSGPPGNMNAFKHGLAAIQKRREESLTTAHEESVRQQILDGLIADKGGDQIIDFTAKRRMPAIFHTREFVEASGLMSYAPSSTDLFRRAATYVDKILKGAKPADLPVEQPIKFEFIINLKAAKQIGLTIPPNVLARADTVIK